MSKTTQTSNDETSFETKTDGRISDGGYLTCQCTGQTEGKVAGEVVQTVPISTSEGQQMSGGSF